MRQTLERSSYWRPLDDAEVPNWVKEAEEPSAGQPTPGAWVRPQGHKHDSSAGSFYVVEVVELVDDANDVDDADVV